MPRLSSPSCSGGRSSGSGLSAISSVKAFFKTILSAGCGRLLHESCLNHFETVSASRPELDDILSCNEL
jgi:hypothetical protein